MNWLVFFPGLKKIQLRPQKNISSSDPKLTASIQHRTRNSHGVEYVQYCEQMGFDGWL